MPTVLSMPPPARFGDPGLPYSPPAGQLWWKRQRDPERVVGPTLPLGPGSILPTSPPRNERRSISPPFQLRRLMGKCSSTRGSSKAQTARSLNFRPGQPIGRLEDCAAIFSRRYGKPEPSTLASQSTERRPGQKLSRWGTRAQTAVRVLRKDSRQPCEAVPQLPRGTAGIPRR